MDDRLQNRKNQDHVSEFRSFTATRPGGEMSEFGKKSDGYILSE